MWKKKSVFMFILSTAFKLSKVAEIYINNVPLIFVNTVKYLGHVLDSKLKDDCDKHQQCRRFCVQARFYASLVRNFNACSLNVKCVLFNSFCTGFMGVICAWISPIQVGRKYRLLTITVWEFSLMVRKRQKMKVRGNRRDEVIHLKVYILCISSLIQSW